MAVQSQIVYFGTELFDILLHFDMSHMQEINEKKNVGGKNVMDVFHNYAVT